MSEPSTTPPPPDSFVKRLWKFLWSPTAQAVSGIAGHAVGAEERCNLHRLPQRYCASLAQVAQLSTLPWGCGFAATAHLSKNQNRRGGIDHGCPAICKSKTISA